MAKEPAAHVLDIFVAGVKVGDITRHYDKDEKKFYWRAFVKDNQCAYGTMLDDKFPKMESAYKAVLNAWKELMD